VKGPISAIGRTLADNLRWRVIAFVVLLGSGGFAHQVLSVLINTLANVDLIGTAFPWARVRPLVPVAQKHRS
jgi:hypothetical protein